MTRKKYTADSIWKAVSDCKGGRKKCFIYHRFGAASWTGVRFCLTIAYCIHTIDGTPGPPDSGLVYCVEAAWKKAGFVRSWKRFRGVGQSGRRHAFHTGEEEVFNELEGCYPCHYNAFQSEPDCRSRVPCRALQVAAREWMRRRGCIGFTGRGSDALV